MKRSTNYSYNIYILALYSLLEDLLSYKGAILLYIQIINNKIYSVIR